MARLEKRIREQIRRWRDDLINLSRRNRLLYFRHTKTSTLEIERPSASEILRRLEAPGGRGWNFYVPPQIEEGQPAPTPKPTQDELLTSKLDESSLTATLRALERKAAQEFMDKGLWVLYLGIGILEWVDPEDRETAQSPIWLVPVTVQRENPREPFRLRRAEDDALVNPALAVKLASEFGIEVPSVEELEDADPDSILALFSTLVRSHAEWHVTPRVVLSTFSFHKEVMYRDLLNNEEQIATHPLVGAIALGSEAEIDLDFEPVPEDDLDEQTPPEETVSILDADASQRQCIVAARTDHSFVMDGPPGTGKSQTIANIIAELLTAGKTVLFVSEKAAALEVVQSRLEEAGLGEFVLALHSHRATRREVAQELGRALTIHPRPPRGLEAIEVQKLIDRRKELSAYAGALNEVRAPLQKSLHDVLGRIGELHSVPSAPPIAVAYETLTPSQFTHLVDTAAALGRAWGPVDRADEFLWQNLRDNNFGPARVNQVRRILETGAKSLSTCERLTTIVAEELRLPWMRSSRDSRRLVQLLNLLDDRHVVPVSWLTGDGLEQISGRVSYLKELSDHHQRLVPLLIEAAGQSWRSVDHSLASLVDQSIHEMSELNPSWTLPPQANELTLRSKEAFLDETSRTLKEINTEAEELARPFGLSTRGLTLNRARELAELGTLVGAPDHPEGDWLNPAVFTAVRNASEILKVLVEDYTRRRRELSEIFADSVLDLATLKDLCVRFETVHRGFGRFKKQYRQDRKLVASYTRAGKVKRATIRYLRDALAWQELTARLKEAEEIHAQLLGTYYRQDATDFQSLTAALEVAQRALELAGRHLDLGSLRKQLARDGHPDPDLLPRGQALLTRIDAWREQALGLLEGHAELVAGEELPAASLWCAAVQRMLAAVVGAMNQVAKIAGPTLTLASTREVLQWRQQIHTIESELDVARETDSSLLGPAYAGIDTDYQALEVAISWSSDVRKVTEGAVLPRTADRLVTSDMKPDDLVDALGVWEKRRDEIANLFADPRSEEIAADLDASFEEGRALLQQLDSTISDIEEWLAFAARVNELSEDGLEAATSFCIEQAVSADQVAAVIEKSLLESWADGVFRERLGFDLISRKDRDRCVEEFRELDRRLVGAAASRVIEACNARRPRTTVGVAGIIVKEAQKRKKHMPIRRLIGDTGPVAQALKPCFMMSPLTVSQFLLPQVSFDAVIFDEASQVTPADAVNCIYRARQLIVAGDQKQLPPTSFFERVAMEDGDQWEEEQFDEFESVLDLCKGAGGFRSLPLRWHYRSQHESLITFSNYSFYEGNLITFPGALETAPDVGCELIKVGGVYRRGGPRDNPMEAEKVVERVLHHARSHPHLSLGVVAFSEAQAGAIEVVLERERRRHPELDAFFSDDRLHGFFVKNLENVQGDERDIIIFSVGYGKDEAGKFTLQFGPLNKPGGWRRLNVAITRAKRRVEVVASVTAGDFSGELGNPGVRHLKRYLDYCERGLPALALELGEQQLDVESPFEADVARVVRGWGYDVVPQVGCANYRIDLGVRHPEKPGSFAIGIECDGVMYHSSKVARDRDRLRQEVLEGLGWRLHRIWGTAWYRDRETEGRRLQAAISAGISGADAPVQPRATIPTRVEMDFEEVHLSEQPEWLADYEIADPRPPRYAIEMHDPSARPDLKRMVGEVISVESPVHEDVVLRRVREAWGRGRAGSRIREAFTGVVKALVRDHVVEKDRAGFLWQIGKDYSVRSPVDNDPETRRRIQEVCVEEIQLAMKWLAEDARSLTRDELSTRVARIFGWNRRGSDIAPVMDEAIEGLIEAGALRETGDYLEHVERNDAG